MSVPFLDLTRQAAALRDELEDAFTAIVARGRFVGGPAVERFEQAFAAYCGAPYAVGVNSGTDAIALALRALGIGVGDEVITAANTCVATITGIVAAGATPVLADVEERTWTLDPASAESAITSRTRALVPVHLYGQCADLTALLGLARTHGLKVIEDAAQAHGAEYGGKRPGGLADAAAYSFYPTKNLGALGDAGAVVTSNPHVAERVRMLRSHGERADARGIAETQGANSRLDEVQAEILVRKLAHLERWNERRRQLAAYYGDGLASSRLTLPVEAPGRRHAWHLFVVLVDDRDRFRTALRTRQVGTLVHYPLPIHRQAAYQHLGGRLPLPVSDRASSACVSLPLYPELTDAEAEQVVGAAGAW